MSKDFDLHKGHSSGPTDYSKEIAEIKAVQKREAERSHERFMAVLGVILILGGLYGVHAEFQYSGWAIFIGAMLIL